MTAKKLHEPSGEFTTQANPRNTGSSSSDVGLALKRSVEKQSTADGFLPTLGWTHYRTLTKVEHPAERRFYEIEAAREGWSTTQLERQIHTQLFARLLKSRNKAGVMDLTARGQVLERPIDAIKHPYVLDFLSLPEGEKLHESDLEGAILGKLQHFGRLFAAKYVTYLPSVEELQLELARDRRLLEGRIEGTTGTKPHKPTAAKARATRSKQR